MSIIKNKIIQNKVKVQRNQKAIAWLYKNAGRLLDFKDGDKVKLDLDALQKDPDWPNLRHDYKDFVLSNPDTLFTVQFEPRYRDDKTIACLAEDPSEPKRLFWVGYLIKQQEEQSND